jgi:thiol-disulfide isomerase/thioredoxin
MTPPMSLATMVSFALLLPSADIVVKFEPGNAGTKIAPRYSPYGKQVPLRAASNGPNGGDPLEGRLKLGPNAEKSPGLRLVLTRSESGKPYDRLLVDTDGDGSLENEKSITGKSREQRGSFWSSFAASVQVEHTADGKTVSEAYPMNLWVVVEKADAVPDAIRFSRDGYKAGSATIEGVTMDVIVSDANNDGVLGSGDWWTVRPSSSTSAHSAEQSRKIGDFAWAGGKAWKCELDGTAGRIGRLKPFDPGMTEAQDDEARDLYRADRLAPRAKTPIAFGKDHDKAVADAKARKAAYFIDFETTWCGPCALMDKYIYTAEAVVKAAEGVVCVKVDGDDHKDLKEKYLVDSFPTGILFDFEGREIARFTGYGGVREMQAFFGKAKR